MPAVVSIFAAVAFVSATLLIVSALGGPAELRDRYGVAGIALSVGVHWLLNLTPFGEMLPSATANGAAWGLWLGAGISWLGWVGASLTQYTVARGLRRTLDVEAGIEALPARLRRLPVAHPGFQVFGRMLPLVGLHVVNIASAARGVPLRRFLPCALVGHAGPALLLSAVGAGLVRLF